MRAPYRHLALPALLAAFVLGGCQDAATSDVSAPDVAAPDTTVEQVADCIVDADDLDALEAQFQARFKTISGVLLLGEMPPEGLVERLDPPFSGEIKSEATAATADAADASLTWTVPLDFGCELPTDGSDDPAMQRPPVTAVKLSGRKNAKSEFYFEPLNLITEQ